MPSTGGYLVSPRSIALIAACLMLSGVSKSGSPTESEITSRPLALRSRAFCVIAMVADGLTRERTSARKATDWRLSVGVKKIERRTYSEAKAARQPWSLGIASAAHSVWKRLAQPPLQRHAREQNESGITIGEKETRLEET